MKTYRKLIEQPMLEIYHDQFADSPREDSTLGYFVTTDERYKHPDDCEELRRIVIETQYESQNVEEHIAAIVREVNKAWAPDSVTYITPITTYRHGNVVYRQGAGIGFDVSNNAFYIVTKESAGETPEKYFSKVIDDELSKYSKWCNGEVYGYNLYDEVGEVIDSCATFYDIEDIRKELPATWKSEDLNEYIKYE